MANTSSNITENLMSLSRLMAAQVQQSEQTMGTLGNNNSRYSIDTQPLLLGNSDSNLVKLVGPNNIYKLQHKQQPMVFAT